MAIRCGYCDSVWSRGRSRTSQQSGAKGREFDALSLPLSRPSSSSLSLVAPYSPCFSTCVRMMIRVGTVIIRVGTMSIRVVTVMMHVGAVIYALGL
eukprot:3149122-Rhodomonas_salina.1